MYDPHNNVYILKPISKTKTENKAKTETTSNTKFDAKAKTKSSDKTMERLYGPDEDDFIPKHKDITKTETKAKAVVPCWACGETFKDATALKTHMNKHWRENIATTNVYVIKSSINQKQIYITQIKIELVDNSIESVDYL